MVLSTFSDDHMKYKKTYAVEREDIINNILAVAHEYEQEFVKIPRSWKVACIQTKPIDEILDSPYLLVLCGCRHEVVVKMFVVE